jgi:hypothetical protein
VTEERDVGVRASAVAFCVIMFLLLIIAAVGVWNYIIHGDTVALNSALNLLTLALVLWLLVSIARGIANRGRVKREA